MSRPSGISEIAERDRAAIERYIQSYREQPESDEEVLAALQTAATVLA